MRRILPWLVVLLLFSWAAQGADPGQQIIQALQKNPDPADITGWAELPAATRAQAVHLVEAGLANHPEWIGQPVHPIGWPRLHLAAFRGQVEIVRLFLDHGASMEADAGPPVGRISALHTALGLAPAPVYETPHPSVELLQLLIKRGANVNEPQSWTEQVPLHAAAARPDLAQVLLEYGANVNAVDKKGRTPLFGVTTPAAATLLENHGARLDVRDSRGLNPLQAAALSGLPDSAALVDWYLARGIQPDIWSMAALGKSDAVQALVEQNPSLARKLGPDGCCPLNWAIRLDHPDTVRVLLQHGADPNQKDNFLEAPLHLAVYHADMVGLLLEAGARPGVLNGSGETALHVAAREGQAKTVEVLLAHKAPVNVRRRDGDTPLLLAVQANNPAIVEALLKAGANPNVQGNVGQTPLSLSHRSPAIEALLKKYGAR